MKDGIILHRDVPLPAETRIRMKEWRESPRKSYDSLPDVISHKEILESDSPTLSQIRRHVGAENAEFVVSMAIEDVNRMFRRDRRMEDCDIVFTAKAILRRYWYLKPEDIKKCFNGRRPKQFVLEGDSFLSWLGEYDLERDNACEEAAMADKAGAEAQGGVSYDDWLAALKAEAASGNEKAAESLEAHNRLLADLRHSPTEEQLRKKEMDFRIFKHNYLKSKGLIKTDK